MGVVEAQWSHTRVPAGVIEAQWCGIGKISHRNLFRRYDTDTSPACSCDGVCLTDLRLDTSTNGLKQVCTSPQTIY
jgi:hypothetical protein